MLVVRDFKYDLLSVSQLNKQLFDQSFPLVLSVSGSLCWDVKGISKETEVLYILLDHNIHHDTKRPKMMIVNLHNVGEDLLWNKRSGHPFINVLRKMSLALEG